MPYSQDDKKWTVYSALIILLSLFLLIQRWQLLPNFLDTYYHLSAAQGFDKAGGLVTHAFWEYAPAGRPHLYPPLLSLIILAFIKLGFQGLFITRLLSVVIFPCFLYVVWLFSASLFNRRTAFFAVLISVSLYSLFLSVLTFMPITIAVMMGLLSFWAVQKNRVIAASIFLALSFYTHAQFSWVITISFLAYALTVKPSRAVYLRVVALGIMSALPIIIYLFVNRLHYHITLAPEKFVLEINLTLILAVFAARAVFAKKGRYYYPLILVISALPFSLVYPYRYISGQGLIGVILLAAIAVDSICRTLKNRSKILVTTCLALLIVLSPAILMAPDGRKKFEASNSTYSNLISPNKFMVRPNEYSVYSKFIGELVDIARRHTGKDDIIFVNRQFADTIIASLADRSSSRGMLLEIAPYQEKGDIADAKLVIWLKNADSKTGALMPEIVTRYALQRVAETEMAYVYRNTKSLGSIKVAKAVISDTLILVIFAGVLFLLIWDLKKPAG